MTDIRSAFDTFDRENPHVYQMFCRFTLQMLGVGHRRLSSKFIVERIRWETMLQTVGSDFKINNNFTPYLARKFMSDFPNHADVFETRMLVSA